MSSSAECIAYQGMPGANSNIACQAAYPEMKTLPCRTFEEAFLAVHSGKATLAMIPIDNSIAGRVADIHHLLPSSGLKIIGEHFQPVNHQLLAVPGTKISNITHVHSHIHALNQCRTLITELKVEPVVHVDTAGAASDIAKLGDKTQAAIASALAAKLNSLEILKTDIEDAGHNTTRFIVMSKTPNNALPESGPLITSFVFRVRNVPAALFKALGGFATNSVNITKLESYVREGFISAQFYADVEGHPEEKNLKLAFEELAFFSHEVKLLGTYPAHSFRYK
ncbi:MAG: prephenate dehydratase [Magnetovibrio sp.]|nr:prephenate dehydratase [Magnetovibrio sp.]